MINILTRTSNRPNGFRRLLESVRGQTYKNINHIVCTDDLDSVEYIKENGVKEWMLISKEDVIEKYPQPVRLGWRDLPHNLYFNEMIHKIKDGWVMYLDDDDMFYSSDSVKKLVREIEKHNEDALIYFQMEYSWDGSRLPESLPSEIGKIGGSCIIFHSKYKDYAVWDAFNCSDFRVIQQLEDVIPNKHFIKKPFVLINSIGMGERTDID